MLISRIYKKRFSNVDFRNSCWKIIIKYIYQKFIKKNDVVLDLACGYGFFINNVKCARKIGVDINPDCTGYLKKDVKFVQSNVWKTTLPALSVDLIYIANLFEHLTHREIVVTIKECYRILKKRGRILILQPNIRLATKDYWMVFDHITPIDDRALDEIFGLHGFLLRKKIFKFLPYMTKKSVAGGDIFLKTYLSLPFLWRFFGKVSFMVYEKLDNKKDIKRI